MERARVRGLQGPQGTRSRGNLQQPLRAPWPAVERGALGPHPGPRNEIALRRRGRHAQRIYRRSVRDLDVAEDVVAERRERSQGASHGRVLRIAWPEDTRLSRQGTKGGCAVFTRAGDSLLLSRAVGHSPAGRDGQEHNHLLRRIARCALGARDGHRLRRPTRLDQPDLSLAWGLRSSAD